MKKRWNNIEEVLDILFIDKIDDFEREFEQKSDDDHGNSDSGSRSSDEYDDDDDEGEQQR